MVLASHDQKVLRLIQRLDPDIMISFERVPYQSIWHASLGRRCGDRIGPHRLLFCVDDDLVIDRRVGREHCGAGPDHGVRLGADLDEAIALVVRDVGGVRVKANAKVGADAGQGRQIACGVKAPLIGEAQGPAAIFSGYRGTFDPLDVDPDLAARVKLVVKLLRPCSSAATR